MAEEVDRRFYPAVLVDGAGNFNTKFEEDLKLAAESRPITALSIIGIQNTGKSTFLNRCFDTGFQERNSYDRVQRTTKGIWVAKCPSSNGGHDILVIDTEGSDGVERVDDVRFEKQIALFALAISNTVIINMKCDNVNLNEGSGRPLLRTIFEMMIKKFSNPCKVNLVFALRDKNECPSNILEEQVMETLNEIWNDISKPQALANAQLYDYFVIKVEPLSHYRHEREQFLTEVADLREWIISNSTSGEVAAGRIPASGFGEYAKKVWDEIKEEKDLDLPSYRILVATMWCDRIFQEKYQSFCANETWVQIENDVKSGAEVQRFGETVSSLIDTCLSRYDEEALHYDETKRDAYKRLLIEDILEVVKPTHFFLVKRMKRAILQNFEEEAMDELKRNGVLGAMNTHKFVNKFENQLADVVIKQANWNQATEQLSQLESEIVGIIERVHATNERLEQQKRGKREFWLDVATVGGAVLIVGTGVGVSAFFPQVKSIVIPQSMAVAGTLLAKVANRKYQEIFDRPFHDKGI